MVPDQFPLALLDLGGKIEPWDYDFGPGRSSGVGAMPLLSRKADYALLILSSLHQRPELGCAREIADGFGLSRAFVANILKELCHKGFVHSRRGVKGGYLLAQPPEDIRLDALLDALEDSFHLAECTGSTPGEDVCCVAPVCPVRPQIRALHRRLTDLLHTVTLAELLVPLPPCEPTRHPLAMVASSCCAEEV